MQTWDKEKVFEKNLEQALAVSRYTLALENRETESYRALRAQAEDLFMKAKRALGDKAGLLMRMEALWNQMGAMDNDSVYWQGWRDCVTLLKKIGAL